MFIQEFISKFTIKTFDVGILDGFARINKSMFNILQISSFAQGIAGEFRAVVRQDLFWLAIGLDELVKYSGHMLSGN